MNRHVVLWCAIRYNILSENPNDRVLKVPNNSEKISLYADLKSESIIEYMFEKNGCDYYYITDFAVEYMRALAEL